MFETRHNSFVSGFFLLVLLRTLIRDLMMADKREYDKCLDAMYALGRFGIVLGLSTMQSILEKLGNPQNDFKCIHISGTNGKGSVASSLSNILSTAGYKTGLYTSPHLVSFNERFCINGKQVTDDDIIEAYNVVEAVNNGERSATFFEISTAMAFYLFSSMNVDYAVIETGMGGRLDATNIVNPVLSIITNISVEHKAYLGGTLAEIAGEKAGIIKANTPVVTGAKQKAAVSVIEAKAKEMSAPLYKFRSNFKVRRVDKEGRFTFYGIKNTWQNVETKLLGNHQVDNASLVLAACEVLIETEGLDLSEDIIKKGLLTTSWPGRLEVVSDSPLTIVDGAHNLVAIRKLTEYLKTAFSGRKITLVTGVLDDKSYTTMFKCILPVCSRVVITEAKSERSIPSETLVVAAKKYISDTTVIKDIPEAIQFAENASEEEDVICISGSLYVVGEAKEFFQNRVQQP